MKSDPTVLGILHNYFNAISSGMSYVLERTSYSSYVTESSDYGTALADLNGDFFAYPKTSLTIFLGLNLKKAITYLGGPKCLREGDIIITNDPYATDGLSTHLPDVHIVKPVFHNGKLLCYAWAFVHTVDLGGCVPTSLSPAATDIQMEGLRIPPVHLYRAGEVDSDVYNLIRTCSRMPDQLMGDINSMVAAVNTGENKIHELTCKFPIETIRNGIDDLLEQSEQRARKIFANIPDGDYSFEDYLDDDASSKIPLRISVILRICGGEITLDFSNCDPQVPTAFNLITNGHCHTYLYQALMNYVISTDPYIPINGGIARPIHAVLPNGTVVNAEYPAACGLRHPVSMRIYTAVLGALSRIIPEQIPAAGGGQAAIVVISVPNPQKNGEYVSNVVEPMSGGSGGQSYADGVEGIDQAAGFLSNTPVEILENKTDILVRCYELVPDSAGPGKQRGGSAIKLEFEIIRDNSLVMARGQEHLNFQPYGLQGGLAGKNGRVILNPGTDQEETLSKINVLKLKMGDIVSFESPSGGGWGTPWERPAEKILNDVVSGLLSPAKALSDYGVVITGDAVGTYAIDMMQTEMMRRGHTPKASFCDFGDKRDAYEKVWTPAASNALATALQQYPSFLRAEYKSRLHAHFADRHELLRPADITTALCKII